MAHLPHLLPAKRVVHHLPRPTLRAHHIVRVVSIHIARSIFAASPRRPRRVKFATREAHVQHLPADGPVFAWFAPDLLPQTITNLINVGPVELRGTPVRGCHACRTSRPPKARQLTTYIHCHNLLSQRTSDRNRQEQQCVSRADTVAAAIRMS